MALELFKLLGTIAVDNSDAKQALGDVAQEGQQAENKLNKALTTVGKGAVWCGKTTLKGLAVGGAAFGALSVKSMNAAGDLEQNMGGSEQVFGKYAESLQNTAKNAFSEMGLSTSDYLATANKMGALFQGAGFDVEDSMNLSSDAMQRAADVASIMGIDTESAMEAIAGAAKGNFTMMDNLGVAMNDTTLNAYALEKGLDKTTQEMTNQEKIGLAMEMFMEKTAYAAGNYAKENETLAGSLGTAKSALTNFLDGSGSVEDVVSSFSNAGNVIVDSLTEIVPRLADGLTDIVTQLTPKIPPLLQKLLPAIIKGATALIEGLVTALPGILGALMDSLPAIIQGIQSIINAVIEALPQIIQALVDALPSIIPMLIDAFVSVIVTICKNIDEIILPLIEAIPDIIKSIVSALIGALPDLIAGVGDLVIGLVKALPSILASLIEGIWSIFTGIWDGIKNIFGGAGDWFKGVFGKAKDAVQNVWSGVKGFFGKCWNGIKGVFSKTGNWFKEKFSDAKEKVQNTWSNVKGFFGKCWDGIKGVFSKTGNWFKEKFTDAKDKAKNAWSNAKEVFGNVYSKIKGVFSNVGGWFKDKFKTGFSNAKNAWSGAKSAFSNIWSKTKGVFSNVGGFFKDKFSDAWTRVKNVFSGVKDFFLGLWNKIKNTFSQLGTKIGGAISGAVKGAINGVLGMIEGIINGFFKLINGAIGLINKIPGVEISKIKLVSFTRLAKGGVVDKATPAIFGEDGAEAVVPLEKNTEWIQRVAEQLHSFTLKADFSAKSLPIEEISAAFDSGVGNRMGRIEALLEKVTGLLSDAPGFFRTAESGQKTQLQALRDILTGILEGQIMVLDDGTLVAKTAQKMNVELGKIAIKKGRGR